MKTIVLDFDGVIHKYSEGWKDGTIYDDPIPGVDMFLIALAKFEGYSIVIQSTRTPESIYDWCLEKFRNLTTNYGITFQIILDTEQRIWNKNSIIGITNHKIVAHIYIDDRGYKFEGSFAKLLGDIQEFKTWQEKT